MTSSESPNGPRPQPRNEPSAPEFSGATAWGAGVEYVLPPSARPSAAGRNTPPAAAEARAATVDPVRMAQKARQGDALYRQGRFAEAFSCYAEAAQMRPDVAGLHYRAGMSAWQAGRLDVVERHLLEAGRLAPREPGVQESLGQWFRDVGDIGRAMLHSGIASELAPGDHAVAVSRAFVLESSGDIEGAWRVIEPVLASATPPARLGLLYSGIARRLGREDDALVVVARLLDAPHVTEPEKPPLHFAASRLLDAAGRYDEAFAHARLANEGLRRPYSPAAMSHEIDRQTRFFRPATLHCLPRASLGSRRPVFILGMPRSGTSLVEQILASHPQVLGAGELEALSRIANLAGNETWAGGDTYPDDLESVSVRRLNAMAADYLFEISSRNDRATYVTDKMPHNFLHLGLILLLFPDSHVIHCTRDPLDTCLSCYMTYFANGHDYTHDLAHLGSYYAEYRRLMAHWKDVIKAPLIEVQYEDVVNDLEGQTRRLLELLGLPWDARCLSFHETDRPVATASRDQVRRRIYRTSVGRWKHYERHLGPLTAALSGADARAGR